MRVPASVGSGADIVAVTRAWPGRPRDGGGVTIEGRDQRGRLRAGSVGPDGAVTLLPYGVDPRLPGLAGLVGLEGRPAAARAPGLPAELVVHRAGRRAVVRTAEGYTKVLRPGAAVAVAAATRTGELLAGRAGLATPGLVRTDDDSITSSVLPGRPVHELSESVAWSRIWQTWAQAWIRLQRGRPEDSAELPRHADLDEARVVRGWLDRTRAVGLLPLEWEHRGAALARRLEEQHGHEQLVPAHRDLHDLQLLWDGSRLGVLDLDTVCLAAAELDPVNLAVHADLRRAQGVWSPAAAAVVEHAALCVVGAVGSGGVDDLRAGRLRTDRLRTAELATVVRLVCVYSFRPRWRDVVLEWAQGRWHEATDR
ncbi:MAG: phosphotransferase [Ornithinimicrobium sp.]|uniref:phosphotransferase n=1 Tax=Ornithinimicrobium sp. TaxID=1977084 RepID=UPI0026DF6CF2|nr:phosphotransferase [Ornithinimicrobium sp.]MDO5740591.1 phosphotransferase [Ornithinimicrobium sp.]